MRTWLKKNWIALLLLLLSVVMLALGIWRGEVQTVLAKATRICMQCIGLG